MFLLKSLIIGQFILISKLTERKFGILSYLCVRWRQVDNICAGTSHGWNIQDSDCYHEKQNGCVKGYHK